MARGMANGEPIVSQAQTEAFDEGYDRVFGKNRKPHRGRWVWDEGQQKLVSADEYVAPVRALDAPVMVDRFYENTAATDGTDIGSRRKHREYMNARGLAPGGDYSPQWYESRRKEMKRDADRQRHATLERALYKLHKP